MMLITELALTLFAGIAVCFYVADTLYWIYKDQKEEEAEEEKNKEEEEIKERVAKTLYS